MPRRSSAYPTVEIQNEFPLSPLTIKRKGEEVSARPFLKWAGGKTQLLLQFEDYFPKELKQRKIKKYFEPFIGGGAVFFHVMKYYGSSIEHVYLSDFNSELVLAYESIQRDVTHVIEQLSDLAENYSKLKPEKQAEYFYRVRDRYNENAGMSTDHPSKRARTERTAQMIFLNRTCFNGLFRVNAGGQFNVPFGRYKNPKILDAENLRAVSRVLKNARIECGDFEMMKELPDKDSFVYFDPPYRPLNVTSSFTSYSRAAFGDAEQERLARLFTYLAKRKMAKVMLSNSDPHNENPNDDFFDRLYDEHYISRVTANRMINSRADRRGQITELLVTNYPAKRGREK